MSADESKQGIARRLTSDIEDVFEFTQLFKHIWSCTELLESYWDTRYIVNLPVFNNLSERIWVWQARGTYDDDAFVEDCSFEARGESRTMKYRHRAKTSVRLCKSSPHCRATVEWSN